MPLRIEQNDILGVYDTVLLFYSSLLVNEVACACVGIDLLPISGHQLPTEGLDFPFLGIRAKNLRGIHLGGHAVGEEDDPSVVRKGIEGFVDVAHDLRADALADGEEPVDDRNPSIQKIFGNLFSILAGVREVRDRMELFLSGFLFCEPLCGEGLL